MAWQQYIISYCKRIKNVYIEEMQFSEMFNYNKTFFTLFDLKISIVVREIMR